MQPFDLDQMRALVTVAEVGSISGAAPKLFRSQSAISEQVRKLEAYAGVVLLRRGKKGVVPTPAGERLINHARGMLAASDRALEDMRGLGLAGELRLAVTDYFRPSAIADMLKGLRTRYPKLRLHVIVRKSLLIETEAQSSDFDIGLSMRILDGRRVPEGTPVRREALAWVAGDDFQPEPDAPVPLLGLPPDCSLQRFVRTLLDRHGVPYVVAHSASGVAGLQSALAAGLGVTCLNMSAVPKGAGLSKWPNSLPTLPEVEFSLLPPRSGEAPLVAEVRKMLTTQLA